MGVKRFVYIITIGGLISWLRTGRARAQSAAVPGQVRELTTLVLVGALVAAPGAVAETQAQGNGSKKTVNCDAGDSLARALDRADPGDTILVSGTCHERVVITQPVTIDGGGSAVFDGAGLAGAQIGAAATLPEIDGVVVVDGVTNVALVGLTVQNGPANGIVATNGAAVSLNDVTTQHNRLMGLSVHDNATAEAVDCITSSNGASGFDVFTSSSLVLRGSFLTSSNGVNGGEINGMSIVELRGAQVTVSDNPSIGIIAGSRSQLAIFGFSAARGSTLHVSGAGFAGLGFADSSLTVFSDSVITAANNGVGVFSAGGTLTAIPGAGPTFVLRDNGIGMNVTLGGSTLLIAGFDVHGNGTGLAVDDAMATIEAAPGLPASISGNGTNVQLTFGARSTIQGVTIGTPLVCDANVLSRGTTVCP